MTDETLATLLDDLRVGIAELAGNCGVDEAWIVSHVEAGVLLAGTGGDPAQWVFGSRDVLRARRLCDVERRFDANLELAGLFVDLQEELDRLRARLRREGLSLD
jgi:chaperone modulatory protein CbpM